MALIFPGCTHCPLCGKVIDLDQAVVSFSPFVSNERDPLFFFNDAAFHAACFHAHSLAEKAQKIYAQVRETNKNRIDVVTGNRIADPDHYLGLGYLTDNVDHPLYPYNYLHFDLRYFSQWRDLPAFVQVLHQLRSGETWSQTQLAWLLQRMDQALQSSSR